MGRRMLPVALLALAVTADARGFQTLGTTLLVLAVPAAAGAALTVFGNLVQLPARSRGLAAARAEVLLAVLALLAIVVAAAARASAAEGAAVPPLAVSGVVACAAAFGLQALVALLAPEAVEPRAERRPLEPADEPAQAA